MSTADRPRAPDEDLAAGCGEQSGRFCRHISVRILAAIAAASVLILCLPDLSARHDLGGDLLHYWAAARVFVEGGNPYDLREVTRVVQSLNAADRPIVPAWGVPSFFTITAPLSYIAFGRLVAFWMAAAMAAYFWCVARFGAIFSETRSFRWCTVLFLCTFQPALLMIKLGQPALVVWCGLLLFLSAHSRERGSPAVAGLGLALTSLKPHLLSVLYVVLLAYSLTRKKIRAELIWAAAGAVVLACAPLLVRADIYPLYVAATGTNIPPHGWRTPTLGTAVQHLLGSETMIVKLLPTVLILAGVAVWLMRGAMERIAEERMLRLALVLSLAATPYCWTYDFTLLLPSILWLLHGAHLHPGRSGARWMILSVLVVANLVLIFATNQMEYDLWYPWLLLLLFGWAPLSPDEAQVPEHAGGAPPILR